MLPEPNLSGIILVRHGETAWNAQRRVMGDSDIALSEVGQGQAAAAAVLLRDLKPSRIVSSPLARALQTAAIIGAELGIGCETDTDLEEVRYGDWSGKTYAEIAGDPRFERLLKDPEGARTPGGETIREVQERGLRAIERLSDGTTTLVVSHGDILRTIVAHYLCVPLRRFRRIRIDNCGISAVALADGGKPEVMFVNLLADAARAWHPLHWGTANAQG